MSLPLNLQQALNNIINNFAPALLQQAYSRLSTHYRDNREQIHYSLNNEAERISYIAARMPATFAAVVKGLNEISLQDNFTIKSILDVGAGPGTASWACCELFPSIEKIQLIEQNKEMLDIAKTLAQQHEKLKTATWINGDVLDKTQNLLKADLVIASYSFNEIASQFKEEFLNYYWELTNKILIIIDPGTPESFQGLSMAREFFIKKNAHILAPCPHHLVCPAQKNRDWCHFSVRLQRSLLHKNLKQADKGYEDEKFSYLIVSKTPTNSTYSARITRHPDIHSGHLKLQLCTSDGSLSKTYSKKDGSRYKAARKAEWGERWEL